MIGAVETNTRARCIYCYNSCCNRYMVMLCIGYQQGRKQMTNANTDTLWNELMELGRLGGNTANSPYRQKWLAVRQQIKDAETKETGKAG